MLSFIGTMFAIILCVADLIFLKEIFKLQKKILIKKQLPSWSKARNLLIVMILASAGILVTQLLSAKYYLIFAVIIVVCIFVLMWSYVHEQFIKKLLGRNKEEK